MIELGTFKKILEENEERFPLLTLDEFFNGNTEEDSIAPNQWEFGRPTLSEIWDMLQKIELMPNIAWVRVALHDDTEIVENNGAEELVLAGDSTGIRTAQIFHLLLAVISNRQNRRKALKLLDLLRNQNHPKLSSFIRCYP